MWMEERFHFDLIGALHRLGEVVGRLEAIPYLGASAKGLVQANVVHSVEILGDEDYIFVTAKDTLWVIQRIKV